jgi:peptidyl-prolyl cis-trans isomerase D
LAPASPADAELRAHYEKNKEGYRRAEQRRVRYVFVTADATSVQVSEEQIKMRLSSVAPEERVHARHILISAEEGQEAPEARKKAEEILAKLRAGADFAELAKQNSEDPGSAGRGGDLGFFGRGQMTPEFERSAFSLSPGQTSELVRSPFGFHIINVIEKTQQTPEAQRPLVEFELRQEEANRRARAEAFKFVAEVKTGRPMDEAARARKLSVSTSNYFGLGDTLPGMTVRNDFNQKIFALQKGQVLAPYTGSGGFYVAQLDDIKAPQIAPYEEIREQVVREFKSARGEELARERAFAFEGRLKSGSEFEKAAKDANLAVTTTAFFKKGANVDDTLRFSPELHDRAFRMNLGETSPPISVAGKLVVFQLVEKSQLDSAKFEQEKTQIEQDLIQRKRTGVFTAYVQGVVDQLRKDNQIIVNDQTLDSVGG